MAKTIPIELTSKQLESLENVLDLAGQFIDLWIEDAGNGTHADPLELALQRKAEYLEICEMLGVTPWAFCCDWGV